MKVLQFISNLFDRLFVVVGAFCGSQIPQFMQQYLHRLAGHVEELNGLVNHLEQIAGQSNKTLDQYIYKFLTNGDPDFVRQGEFMEGVVSRAQELNFTLQQLIESPIWERPYYLIRYLQPEIARSTLDSFRPGFTFSIEELCYTGLGIFLGFALYQALAALMHGAYRCATFPFRK